MHPVPQLADLIENSQTLTRIFGEWPTFHDAEVRELRFESGQIDAANNVFLFPSLTVKIHLWSLECEVDERGVSGFKNQTLATLKFHGIEDLKMEGFNYQNAIYGLKIEPVGEGGTGEFAVEFDPAFGMRARFKCSAIEVVDASPCGRPTSQP